MHFLKRINIATSLRIALYPKHLNINYISFKDSLLYFVDIYSKKKFHGEFLVELFTNVSEKLYMIFIHKVLLEQIRKGISIPNTHICQVLCEIDEGRRD